MKQDIEPLTSQWWAGTGLGELFFFFPSKAKTQFQGVRKEPSVVGQIDAQ